MKTSNKKAMHIAIFTICVCALLALYYYITLPAINIHSTGFWYVLLFLGIIITVVIGIQRYKRKKMYEYSSSQQKAAIKEVLHWLPVKIAYLVTLVILLIFIIGSLLSSKLFNASRYEQLINIEDSDFTKDINEISYKDIPILDKDSAILLGSRKMGNMLELVSQFEVSEDYTQINYKGSPVRVSPLEYGNFIKWFNNHSEGVPAYMLIDMATQNVECVKLQQKIKYSKSEYFGRNIYRYIRFKYPTYIFDDISFEIDEIGTPYWICPVKNYTIGLFGGETISNVVIVNACTGEYKDYPVEEVPTWVDHVYSAQLLIDYYDYYGTLRHGFWNSVIGQKDCLKTTEGYNYIANNDDVWVYTGVTSVGQDESNVGFVLMNQRTAKTYYYSIAGAEEYSAMDSAEGKVQHLKYKATFPLLLNISGEPTYFIALKDAAGLVKQYAMVNIEKYNIVAIGDSITECEKSYRALLKENNMTNIDASKELMVTGKIQKIADVVIDGNTHYYIILENNDYIFDVTISEQIGIIKYNVGDTITIKYLEGNGYNLVQEIK